MFLFLSLLEFLMFLLLFGVEPVLLLPVSLVELGVARVRGSEPFVWRNFVGMRRTASIWGAIGRPLVAPSRLPCGYGAALAECTGPGSGCHGRLPVVYGGTQFLVGACFLKVLVLRPDRPDVSLASRGLFFMARSRVNTTIATVIADAVYCRIVVDDRGVVGIVNFRDIDVVHRAVVVKAVVVPAPAFITAAEIAVAVIYAAVKANLWAPLTLMESKDSSAPTPVGRRPEKTRFRSQHPGTGDPKIIIPIPGPIARSPDIALLRADGLLIDGQRRRRIADGNADADLSVR